MNAGKDVSDKPGASVTLKAVIDAADGSTVSAIKWTQTAGVPATLSGADSDTLQVALGSDGAYRDALLAGVTDDDRFGVQPVNPHALSAAEVATFKVSVTTTSGTYSDSVNVNAELPYVTSTGVENVPINVPVLLRAKTQDSYDWTMAAPDGSQAVLSDATTRYPAFTPDVSGKYALTEAASGTTFDVYAGTWEGVITGIDADGNPVADSACLTCHDGSVASDQFTPWATTGHAHILTKNIDDPAGHWTLNCASCHTVGYDTAAVNGGFDEAVAKEGWQAPHGAPDNWATMVQNYPASARLANIQCENCHGPQDSAAHKNGVARESLSSDLCGSCHGEPARHGRFQQWEESGHANLQLAIEEGTVENRGTSAGQCGRCHTGEGFLAWLDQGDLTKVLQGANGNATVEELTALGLTADTVHSQTCAVCHDPHDEGMSSGDPNTATVRVEDNTSLLPAGYQAVGVGRGAICITCHNTRNGLHNDTAGDPTSYSAPHSAAQGDVLMGENAYFVQTGAAARSKHSLIADTCTTCHMELTPPPAEFSYEGAGTNHSFAASTEICSDCHGSYDGGTLQATTEEMLSQLGAAMGSYLAGKVGTEVHVKDYTPHQMAGKSYDLKSDDLVLSADNIASIEPTEIHGQQSFLVTLKQSVRVTYSPKGEAPHGLPMTQVQVQLGDFGDGTTALIPLSDTLVKAGWNYDLLESDASKGIHNPSFTLDVINASINALK